MTVTLSETIQPVAAVRVRGAGNATVTSTSRPADGWRVRTLLMDGVGLLALVWSVPLAILLVGAPVALAIALLLWLARLAQGAF